MVIFIANEERVGSWMAAVGYAKRSENGIGIKLD